MAAALHRDCMRHIPTCRDRGRKRREREKRGKIHISAIPGSTAIAMNSRDGVQRIPDALLTGNKNAFRAPELAMSLRVCAKWSHGIHFTAPSY